MPRLPRTGIPVDLGSAAFQSRSLSPALRTPSGRAVVSRSCSRTRSDRPGATFWAELMLSRYGVLTCGAVAAEGVPGGFATLYKVLTGFEEAGRCQRGYFVESLGGSQFALASTVDRPAPTWTALDSIGPWFSPPATQRIPMVQCYLGRFATMREIGHRPGRKAGALVVPRRR